MPWKSQNVLKEMLGRWYMVSKWIPTGIIKEGETYDKGKIIWIIARCHCFEQNIDGSWWAEFRDLEGRNHPYNQTSVEKIMKFLEAVPDEKLRQYLDLFNLYG